MVDFSRKVFGVISLGCDKNRVDSEKILSIIRAAGCKISCDPEEVQILIINTCAFLNESRKEAIDTVLEYSAYKSRSLEKIVVTGCLPQGFGKEVYDGLIEADVFLGINDYNNLFCALERSYGGERVDGINAGNGNYGTDRVITTPMHYAYLKISDGCNNRCSYCLIPSIRGKYKSTPIEALVKEAENLGEISELILVAQDVTRYGIDLYGGRKLTQLLRALTALENIKSVRLLYAYPDMIDDALIAEIGNNPKIIKYLDIPLQHSEDRILKLMNRPGSRAQYLALIQKLRKNIPGIALRSTFIAGFPSETEEEVQGLAEFLKSAQLDNCGFFAYSREPQTAAYGMGGQINYFVKKSRVKRLYAVQEEISRQKLKGYIGQKIKVLCDGIDYDKNCFVGRAYFQAPEIDGKVWFNAPFAAQGEYAEVLVESCDSYDLYGKTEDMKDE